MIPAVQHWRGLWGGLPGDPPPPPDLPRLLAGTLLAPPAPEGQPHAARRGPIVGSASGWSGACSRDARFGAWARGGGEGGAGHHPPLLAAQSERGEEVGAVRGTTHRSRTANQSLARERSAANEERRERRQDREPAAALRSERASSVGAERREGIPGQRGRFAAATFRRHPGACGRRRHR